MTEKYTTKPADNFRENELLQGGDPLNPLRKGSGSGFFDLPGIKQCRSLEHNPPMYIYIPNGQGYKHVCPQCGKVSILIPPQVTL
jgi:hypothetical protein